MFCATSKEMSDESSGDSDYGKISFDVLYVRALEGNVMF